MDGNWKGDGLVHGWICVRRYGNPLHWGNRDWEISASLFFFSTHFPLFPLNQKDFTSFFYIFLRLAVERIFTPATGTHDDEEEPVELVLDY